MLTAFIIALTLIIVGTLLGVLIYIKFLDPDRCIVLLVVLFIWYIASVVISFSLTRYDPVKDDKYVIKTVTNEVIDYHEDNTVVYIENDQIKKIKAEYMVLTEEPAHLEIVTIKRCFIKSKHTILYISSASFTVWIMEERYADDKFATFFGKMYKEIQK